jgi:transposase-like protein
MKLLGNFRDVFKTLKHRKPSPIFCPKCCSPEIKLSSSLDYWLTPQKYICQKCGYVGSVVMELEEDNEEENEEKTES